MQTREDRNKRRRECRIEKSLKRMKSHKSALIEMYRRAAKEHWSQQRMLAYRKEWIDGGSSLVGRKLQGAYESAYVQGVADTLFDLHWRVLTFCYAHPDKPWMNRPARELCDEGLASRIDLTTGAHFYRNEFDSLGNPADEANEYVDSFNRQTTECAENASADE